MKLDTNGWLFVFCRPKLPEYLLDFGYVVLGDHRQHVVKATNTGWCPVSFQVENDAIKHQGFHVELDRVRNLPGAPDYETVDFWVSFDPRGANLGLGPVESYVPINVRFVYLPELFDFSSAIKCCLGHKQSNSIKLQHHK